MELLVICNHIWLIYKYTLHIYNKVQVIISWILHYLKKINFHILSIAVNAICKTINIHAFSASTFWPPPLVANPTSLQPYSLSQLNYWLLLQVSTRLLPILTKPTSPESPTTVHNQCLLLHVSNNIAASQLSVLFTSHTTICIFPTNVSLLAL